MDIGMETEICLVHAHRTFSRSLQCSDASHGYTFYSFPKGKRRVKGVRFFEDFVLF